MSYIDRASVIAKLPDRFLVEALDDDGDGEEDAGLFDGILANAEREIDGYVEGRYALPLSPVPAFLGTAALVLVLEALYYRRGFDGETNPWRNRASETRARLRRIASGEETLVAGTEKAAPGITAITEPARTHSKGGRLLA